MSSPRSSWSGSITLDLLTIPITLGKATKDVRETSLVTLCDKHKAPINRAERCSIDEDDCDLIKVKGVDMGDGTYRAFNENEYASIEDATKDDRLEILDAQPLDQLPLPFGKGTYYVRAKKDDRAAASGLAALTLGLATNGMGAVVKLCKSAKQDFAILHAYKGMMLLTIVPFVDGLVLPGDQERAHMKTEISDKTVERVAELLKEIQNPEGFDYTAYADDGLRMRQHAVDRVLAGKLDEQEAPKQEAPQALEIMDALMASIDMRKDKKVPA